MRNRQNLPEFVLHALCDKDCFNIAKAAYFIDNPDFDCIKGVAGFSATEAFEPDIWSNPNDFTDYMVNAAFNKKVRTLQGKSSKMYNQSYTLFQDIAQILGLQGYALCDIQMPYDNHGYVMYELQKDTGEIENELMRNSLSLLSFCPLY
jgi:hypothetical protein